MSDRNGGFLGMAALASLAVICCAGPFLVVALAGLGVGAWLAAHGLWLLGGLGLMTAGAALFAYRRRQAVAACAFDARDAEMSGSTAAPHQPRETARR